MNKNQPAPVTMVMLTPEQLAEIVRDAVARATSSYCDTVFDLREAAEHLRVSEKTIQRRVASGRLKPISRRPLRILRSELEK